MAKNKTTETSQSVADFLNTITDDAKRIDSFRLMEIMKEATGFEPKMWGSAIVGFGSYHLNMPAGMKVTRPKLVFPLEPKSSPYTYHQTTPAGKY